MPRMRRAAIALLLPVLLAGGCSRRGREILPQSATTRPRTLRVYTLGDSNGAAPQGWPVQLNRALSAALMPQDVAVYNDSKPSRAIGFQKLGSETNALLVAAESIRAAREEFGAPIDECVVGLGTNDAQNRWA